MNLLERYVAYLKHNPKRYWFRRKVWGWGWVPATWEGWVSLIIFVAVLAWIIVPFERQTMFTDLDILVFFGKILVWTVLLILVCYWKGEPPKWQWGFPEEKE